MAIKKLRLAALLALPIGLGLYLNSVASWRPRTLAVYESPPNLHAWAPSIAFSPDGKQLASTGNGDVSLWDVGQMRATRTLKSLPGKRANEVAFSPDGKSIAASYNDKEDMEGQVRLWDAATGNFRRVWRQQRSMTGVAFSRHGKALAGSGYSNVQLWNTQSGKAIASVAVGDTFWVQDVALSPDGHTIIGLGEQDAIYWWDARKAARDDYWGERPGIRGNCAAFSPDGKNLAVGTTGRVLVYSVQMRRVTRRLASQSTQVNAITFSADGSTLAGGGTGGRVELWDVPSQTRWPLRTLLGHTKTITSLAFAPDSSTLASSSADGTVRLWRLR